MRDIPELSDNTPTQISQVPPSTPSWEDFLKSLVRGRKLAHYELLEPLGVGGMAAVLRAHDVQLDRIVALKILPPVMARDPDNVRRFQQEAMAAARLNQENIARVFDYGEDQDLHYIAFEFVEGENLRNILERRGPLPVAEALSYLIQIATGLVHAAQQEVVHRDIKPSNIIIGSNGQAKLVDMGLARSLEPQRDLNLTQFGVTLGTCDYISPEQAVEPHQADTRSDIYSLGCTFYHALTGQPPVPEGNAAKKLDHQQRVPPLDPRLLNPHIPDEVAAILSRMMAKDPNLRYQHPEHLVQHLLQVTGQPGPGGDGAGRAGVLTCPNGYQDSPLPPPPRPQPLWWGGLAVILVAVLVFLAGRAPWSSLPSRPPGLPSAQVGATQRTGESGNPKGVPPGSVHPVEPGPILGSGPASEAPVTKETKVVASAKELADFLRSLSQDNRDLTLIVAGDLHLSGEEQERVNPADTGLVVRGRRVEVRAKEGTRPTLWIEYRGQAPSWYGLTILATEDVKIQGLRFVADIKENDPPKMGGVLLGGARDYLVQDCEFFQGNWLLSSSLSSLALNTSGALQAPRVTLKQCVFLGARQLDAATSLKGTRAPQLTDLSLGGLQAVAVAGAAIVLAEGCAFGPHHALFRLESPGMKSKLELRHCTALAGEDWAAVHLEKNAQCSLEAWACFFGRTRPLLEPGVLMPNTVATLIRQGDPGASGTGVGEPGPAAIGGEFTGQHNRFFYLDGLWNRALEDRVGLDAAGLRKQFDFLKGMDNLVLRSDLPLWKERDPLTLLQAGPIRAEPDKQDLLEVFHYDIIVPEVRYGPKLEYLVGVPASLPAPSYEKLPLPESLQSPPAARPVKVVDPRRETGSGTYRTLGAALEEVKSGDVISIRHSGYLTLSDSQILKVGSQVTVRAEPGWHPILTLDDRARERGPALFRLQEGQLSLEGLEFYLKPHPEGIDGQSVVALVGGGEVSFKNCVVTLNGVRRPPLAVVLLTNPKDLLPLPPAEGGTAARVVLDNCFCRGDGDLVWTRANRPFQLEVKNTLAGLTGSLVNVESSVREAPMAGANPRVSISLTRLTAYLGNNLIRLDVPDLKGLIPVGVDQAASCLFVPAEGRALLHFQGLRTPEEIVREMVSWKGEQNLYSTHFLSMFDQQASALEMPLDLVSQAKWKDFAVESDSKFVPVKFFGPLWPALPAAEMVRENFRIDYGPQNAGANLDQLPVPQDSIR